MKLASSAQHYPSRRTFPNPENIDQDGVRRCYLPNSAVFPSHHPRIRLHHAADLTSPMSRVQPQPCPRLSNVRQRNRTMFVMWAIVATYTSRHLAGRCSCRKKATIHFLEATARYATDRKDALALNTRDYESTLHAAATVSG